ncbi:MAG: methyltransferase domain-containing protein [Acidobacteriota bacterium]
MTPAGYVFKAFPHSSHRWLVERVGRPPLRVLDVGTWNGFLGRELASQGHELFGIEKDPIQAQHAAVFYRELLVADLETLPPLPGAPFDVILCGDVLEHLREPLVVLKHLVSSLRPEGKLLITVPNVAFVGCRVSLLFGVFEYRDRGILDRTHLRFFTKASLLRLLREAGLKVQRVHGLPPALPLVFPPSARWPLRGFFECLALAARLWPSLWAYQLAVEARRPS